MELRDYARSETAAFVDRLVGAAEALAHAQRTEWEQQLAAVRAELESVRTELEAQAARATALETDLDAVIEAHRQVDGERIAAEKEREKEAAARARADEELRAARSKADEELRGARELLERTRAEATRVSEALEREAAQSAIVQEERDTLRAQLVDANVRLSKIQEENETAATAAREKFHDELRTARAEAEAISADRDTIRAESAALRTEIEQLKAQATELRGQADAQRAAAEARAAEIETLRGEIAQLRAGAEALRAEAEGVRAEREALRGERDAIRVEADGLRAQGSGAAGEVQALQEMLDASRAHHEDQVAAIRTLELRLREAETAGAGTLEAAVGALDALGAASSVGELFSALARQLATRVPRAALFRVKGNHLEGEYAAGGDDGVDMAKLVIPMSVDSVLTRAAASGHFIQADFDLLGETISPFGGKPASALAVPVTFQGETLAVLYGDVDGPVTQAHATFAQLLVRHATVVMSRLTQELKVLKELREYASMLLQEAEQMFVADVEAARPAHESIRRLRDTVECGRQLYSQRAALEGTAAAGLFDEQIAVVINAQASAFAEALAAATKPEKARRTAS